MQNLVAMRPDPANCFVGEPQVGFVKITLKNPRTPQTCPPGLLEPAKNFFDTLAR
ncbi:hypothetical protein RRSWK_01859 [Rhodopirellula sp. SWK7]|nr:hypothetical protein RRSWK_01859 [Rhodopirellula sp. SWK7]